MRAYTLLAVKTCPGTLTRTAVRNCLERLGQTAQQSGLDLGLGADAANHVEILMKAALSDDAAPRDEALRALVGVKLPAIGRNGLLKVGQKYPTSDALVQRALGLPAKSPAPPLTKTDAWLARLDKPGDVAAGRRLFFNKRMLACAACHQVEQRGARVGPDLTYFGQNKTQAQILTAILEPSKEISPQFYTWVITTTDGKSVVGYLHSKRVGAGVENYVDVTGRMITIKTDQVASRQTLKTSIMPPGLLNALTDQELRDLMAFLSAKR